MQKTPGVKHLFHCSEVTLKNRGSRKFKEREDIQFSKAQI